MSEASNSVYPDLLKTGLGKLSSLSSHRELLSLFAALDYFRRDLHAQQNLAGLLQITHGYILGLDLFQAVGFFLVNPVDHGFDFALCGPESERARLDDLVKSQIRSGRFASALRQPSSVFFRADPTEHVERGVLHALAVPSQVLGMFCGLLHPGLAPTNEIAFSLLSMLLGASADAQATMRKTAQLTNEVKTLSGLLPICAWCKKIRDDRGYWEQIEAFVETRSGASFSHSICPECQEKVFADLPDSGSRSQPPVTS